MSLVRYLILLAATASGSVLAQEHTACSDFEYGYQVHSPDELRRLAASCKSASVANLYYNRAYHADMVHEAIVLSGLIDFTDSSSQVRFEAYRMYMAMLEQLVPLWYPSPESRAAFLNREYDKSGEIAALRLRGYDQMADHLEYGNLMR